jgi:hypothetical protein
MRSVTYIITVDSSNNATVRSPGFDVKHDALQVHDGDQVTFQSNDGRTAILYRGSSPFNNPVEPTKNTIFDVGKGTKGPFTVAIKDDGPGHRHHFDCGQRNPAAPDGFSPWGHTQGDDTPTDP